MDGAYSWVICAVCCIANAATCGFYNSYGTLFVAIIQEYQVSETVAAFVGSLSYSMCLLFGCITSPLCSRIGCRQVAIMGAVLYALGLLLSSFAKGVIMLFFAFGLLFPFGASAVYFSSLMVLPQHFERSYALAFGVASSGIGAGGFIFSAITEKLLQSHGLSNTFRILAATGVLLLVGGLLYGKTPTQFAKQESGTLKKRKMLDFKIWKNRAFLIWTICVCLLFSVLYIPFVHLVKRATDLSIPITKASSLLGYISAASSIGKIFFGKLADYSWVNRLYLVQFCLLIVSVNHTLCPLFSSFEALVAYCVIYGFFDGSFGSLLAIIVGDIVGRENLHSAIGAMYLLSSLFMMLGPPLAGILYSMSGSYDSSFFTLGAAVALAVSLMFLVPWFLPKTTLDTNVILEKGERSSEQISEEGTSIDGKLPSKKDSWVTYDSGIDLTMKDNSIYSCTTDDERDYSSKSSTRESSRVVASEFRIVNFFERYIRMPRRTFVPGNLVNSYAVSNLDLNSEELCVVDRVTIV